MKRFFLVVTLVVLQTCANAQNKDTARAPEAFKQVEEQAEFPGGIPALMNFIKANLECPPEARKNGINGKVFVKFVVNESGLLSNIEVISKLKDCDACNEEAIRVVSIMPPWKPAKMSGQPVKCYFNLPLRFNCE